MSLGALKFALNAKTGCSSDKLVLLVLANYANEDGECYPSSETVSRLTEMDIKTVWVSLRRLRESGLITDTGRCKGATGKIVVYRINDDSEHLQKRMDLIPPKTDSNTSENGGQILKGIQKKESKENYTKEFEEFWNLYPSRVNEAGVRTKSGKWDAFLRYKDARRHVGQSELLAALSKFTMATDSRFIPDACRWLKRKPWQDIISEQRHESEHERLLKGISRS